VGWHGGLKIRNNATGREDINTMNTTETKEQLEQGVRNLATGTRQAGRKVWLAGLGVASSVDTESRELFGRLVERGRKRSQKELFTVPQPLRSAGQRVKSLGRALEQKVEGTTSAALERFGVPDRREVKELIERIERLTRKVETLAETHS
jgi:poly(hydroxyalkanoate) granule-associated protein